LLSQWEIPMKAWRLM
jgi:hypothetical protein